PARARERGRGRDRRGAARARGQARRRPRGVILPGCLSLFHVLHGAFSESLETRAPRVVVHHDPGSHRVVRLDTPHRQRRSLSDFSESVTLDGIARIRQPVANSAHYVFWLTRLTYERGVAPVVLCPLRKPSEDEYIPGEA